MSERKILVVDDDDAFRGTLCRALQHRGYTVYSISNGADALKTAADESIDAALIDLKMPGMDGLELVRRLQEEHPDIPTLVLTGHGSIETAIEATRLGAYHYLKKPCPLADLEIHVRNALASRQERVENVRLRGAVQHHQQHETILGKSAAITSLLRTIDKLKDADAPVLVEGDSGSGKELVARALHEDGRRRNEPFVAINCATLKPELLENELFGHRAGAFTGAQKRKPGLLEIADNGTLFIDEIADMDMGVQASLLRVIETGTFRPLGSTREVTVQVRVVVATNRSLSQEVESGRFREDLFYRLSVVIVNVPALRDHLEDIEILARAFLGRQRRADRAVYTISTEGLKALRAYTWPGNVRELHNVLERAALLAEDSVLKAKDFHFGSPRPARSRDGDEDRWSLQEAEERHIQRVLDSLSGNVSHAAERLGIDRRTLQRKMERFGLREDD